LRQENRDIMKKKPGYSSSINKFNASLVYKQPKLYKVNIEGLFNCACMSGDSASMGVSCKAGPEAGGGCGNGAAAVNQCLEGAAASSKCDNGACYE